MSEKAKRIAYLAVFTAIGTLLVVLAAVLPSGRLALLAIASFPVCAALMKYGPGWSAGVFVVTAALGFLLFPGVTAIGYAAFFGYYPILKSLIERCGRIWLELLLKWVVYTAAFLLYWFLARTIFFGMENAMPVWALYCAGLAVFVIYDWCYNILIHYYLSKIARFLK